MQAGPCRLLRTPFAPLIGSLVFACFLVGCDIPTRGPDFSFRPRAAGPLIFEKTLVFLGPDGNGTDALIDTTDATFDSLFSVDPADDGVYIVQDLEGFDLLDIDDVIDPITLDPEDIAVTIEELASQTFETSFQNTIGVLEAAAQQSPWLTPDVTAGTAYVPLTVGDVFRVPTNGVIDLSGAELEYVVVSPESGSDVNRLFVQLANGLAVDLTGSSGQVGTVPFLVLESGSGSEIARTAFDRSPAPGETAYASLDLSTLTLPSDGRFELEVSTSSGFAAIERNAAGLSLMLDVTAARYDGFAVSDIPQAAAEVSRPNLTLTADVDFTGTTTRSGSATIRVTNTLPIPIQLQSLTVTNQSAVGTFPAGHVAIRRAGDLVPANSAIDIRVSMGADAISRTVSAQLQATAQATPAITSFTTTDGLSVAVTGDLDVDVLYYRPQGEIFSETSSFSVSTTEVTFASSADFVEVASGALDITDLVNGLDLTFEDVAISFPDILTSPYRPEDSLVVRFTGSADGGNGVDFAKLERNAPPRDVTVDLAGTRISAVGNEVRYSVVAISETTGSERTVAYDDEISTTALASNLLLSRISAVAEPFSASLTDDVNGDGFLDPYVSGEAVTSELNDFGPLNDVSGLELVGAELSVNVLTSIAGDLKVYGILSGEDEQGNIIYLRGRSELAVAQSDTMVGSFRLAGSPVAADQMFALPLTVQGAAGQPSPHTIRLTDANSNISEFVSTLPSTLRFVGKAIVGRPGERIEVTQPSTIDMSVGIAVPLNVRGSFELRRMESANLTSLSDLTDPTADFVAESATLTLSYSNGIPLGLDARLEFLDAAGNPTVSLPLRTDESLALQAAPSNGDGYASGISDGEIDFELADSDLVSLARSENLRLVITFAAPNPSSGRIRASDSIRLALRGEFRFNVQVGG